MKNQQTSTKLKPVTFVGGTYDFNRKDDYKQKLLLKAMMVSSNPNDWKKAIGTKLIADVYRTLDKMALRKEYHAALAENGVTFGDIVKGIKELASNSDSDSVRLNSYKTILKSLGLDRYDENKEAGASWEEALLSDHDEKEKQLDNAIDGECVELEEPKVDSSYEVEVPPVPDDEREAIDREQEIGKSLYED